MRRVAVFACCALTLAGCSGDGTPPSQPTPPQPVSVDPERAARADLGLAKATANTYYVDRDTYSGFDAAAAAEIEPGLAWIDGTDPDIQQVSIVQADANAAHLVTRSPDGPYLCVTAVLATLGSPPTIGSGPSFAAVDTAEECAAAA